MCLRIVFITKFIFMKGGSRKTIPAKKDMEEQKSILMDTQITEKNNYSCDYVIVPREKIIVTEENEQCGYGVEKDITGLALSIRMYGLGSPLNVLPKEDGTYILIGGHRRIKALRYGDEQEWGWFEEGYPCVISKSPNSMDNDLDRKIAIHELNIHNRNNSSNYFGLIRNLLELYEQKLKKENSDVKNDCHYTAKVIQMLSDKLGVSRMQGYKLSYIANEVPKWIEVACAAGKLTKDMAYQIGHMPDHLLEELHEIFKKQEYISKEQIDMYLDKKFIETDAPDWIKDAVSKGIISVKIAKKIFYSSNESKERIKLYYQEHGNLPAEIISQFYLDKKGNSISVEEIKKFDQKTRETELIESLSSGKLNLKQFRDPLDFDVNGLGSNGENYSSEDTTEDFLGLTTESDYIGVSGTGRGYSGKSQPSYSYEKNENYSCGYDNTEYEESEDDYDPYNDGDYSVEDDFDEEAYYDDEEDSLVSKKNDKTDDFAPAPHFDNTKHCVDGNTQEDISHKSENKIYKHSPRDNEGSSGKTKQLIMSDSTWWFNRMAENQTMSDSEMIYVDTMVSLMQQFYFSSLKKRLDEKSLSENIISDLRKIYESLSELFE